MKTKKNLYKDILNYDNALKMFYKIKRMCRNKKAVYKFEMNLNTNIMNILLFLKDKKYRFSKYNIFLIKKPKYRIIMSENIQDKLVNHLVSKYILIPSLEHKLIDTNVATRLNKGTSYAFEKFQKYINILRYQKKEIYILKIDIKKYFYNIDHELLFNMLKKNIKDNNSLEIIKEIIDSTNYNYINKDIKNLLKKEREYIEKLNINKKEKNIKISTLLSIPTYEYGKGIPIGNMTSQILAIFYLNDVDHFIKEKLKFKYYIRYMDDLLIMDTDINRLKESLKLIVNEINKLKLEINSKTNIYKLSNGVNFLGYRFQLFNKKLIIKYNKKTIRNIDKKLKNLYKYDYSKFIKTIGSYNGYLKLSNTNFYKNNILDFYEFKFKEK